MSAQAVPYRVVHLHKFAGISGSENHLASLLGGLDRARYEPWLLMLEAPGFDHRAYVDRLAKASVKVSSLCIRGDVDPTLPVRLVRWLKRVKPIILHTHLVHADFYGLLAARLAGVPIVVSSKHNDDPFRRRKLYRWVERAAVRRTDRVIAISDSIRRFTLGMTGVDAARVVTVHYGYKAPQRCLEGPLRLGIPEVPEHARVILSVGRLVPQKGHVYLVRAFAQIAPQFEDAWLVIAGNGELRQELAQLASSLGVERRVRLIGYRHDVDELMRACQLLAHSALWEGFGLVLLEALGAGLPIVATAVGAIPEIVRDGETGLLVQAGDVEALAAAMARLLSNPAEASRFAARGREALSTQFSVEGMVRATEVIYDDCLDEAKRAGRLAGPS